MKNKINIIPINDTDENIYKCVMYFLNFLIDTDRKNYNFCYNCLKILSTYNQYK